MPANSSNIPNDFNEHVKIETVVLDANGVQIARYDGQHEIHGAEFEKYMPITYKVIRTSMTLIASGKIEPAIKNNEEYTNQ